MKSLKIILLFVISQTLFSAILFAQQKGDITDPKEVIKNAITALGGKEYLETIKTRYTDVSTEMDGRQVHYIVKEMLPNKGSFQIVYRDKVVYQNWFNGVNGYEISNGKIIRDDDDFKNNKLKKNIFDELDYPDTTLWKLELLGEEKVNSEPCYKIKASLVDGLVKILYYSKVTFYLLREDKVSNPEKDAFTTAYYFKYRKIRKLTYYSLMKFGVGDTLQTGKVVNMLINENVSDNDFK